MNNGLHHLHVRRRIYKNLETYPHPDFFKRMLDRVMFVVAVVMPLFLLPQVLQLYESKDAHGLSLYTWSLLGVANVLWVVYGFAHKAKPIMVSSFFMGLLNFTIAVGIVLYR